MTGTSLDGLDVALVEATGEGPAMRVRLVAQLDRPLGDLAAALRALAEGEVMNAADIAAASLALGELHADACRELAGGRRIDLVALHGQTVFHRAPASWQLINPWPVAAAIGCDVVSDLRGADLAAGGQGAPITPLSDLVMFGGDADRLIVNLGGFCNVTALRGDGDVRGFDVCACNQLLDAAARKVLGEPFDRDGAAGLAGHADGEAVEALKRRLLAQRDEGRSLGSGDEFFDWLDRQPTTNDTLATAAAGVGGAIRDVLDRELPHAEVVAAGGGARNKALLAAIGTSRSSADSGVPIDAREAMAMAVLGLLARDGEPITLPAVTGRRQSVPSAGQWIHATPKDRP